jgi:hypothetical protein
MSGSATQSEEAKMEVGICVVLAEQWIKNLVLNQTLNL